MGRPRSVAVVGKFGAGKTTLAERLIKDYSYVRVGFANRLKEVAEAVYGGGRPVSKGAVYALTDETTGKLREVTGRRLLQELGQSVKVMDRDLWIRWLDADIRDGKYGNGPFAIDDCRFPYEANYLRDELGFVIVKLDTPDETRFTRYERLYGRRPSEDEVNHPSETQVDAIVEDLLVPGDIPVADLARIVVRSV
jgi:hypothetical protein